MIYQVNEGVSAQLSGVFKDEAGSLLGSGQMTGIVGSLYDKATGTFLDANAIPDQFNKKALWPLTSYEFPPTLDASGNFVLPLGPRQTKIITPGLVGSELHILLLEWTYEGGVKAGKTEFQIGVKNLSNVP